MWKDIPMNVDEIVQYWLTTAAEDLVAAEHLFESKDYTHALFFGHLYLEKLLKAQVVERTRQHAPLSHNLRYLAEKGDLGLTQTQESFLVRVTEYSIKARYPDMDRQFRRQCTREFCHAEIVQIREFGTWIKQEILS
jgi:HEPN domain-containing protein